jgi:hypothetical protein
MNDVQKSKAQLVEELANSQPDDRAGKAGPHRAQAGKPPRYPSAKSQDKNGQPPRYASAQDPKGLQDL